MKNFIFQAIEDYRQSSTQRKIEFWALACVFLITAITFIVIIRGRTAKDLHVEDMKGLKTQNANLQKSNEVLLRDVGQLSRTIQQRNKRDSTVAVMIAEQNNMLPALDDKLQKIDKKYENLRITSNNMSAADVQNYVAGEADRIRNSQNAGSSPDH